MSAQLLFHALCRALVLPPGGPLLLALAGLVLLRRRPRLARGMLAAGLVTLLALTLPVVADLLCRATERYPALDASRLPPAELIVVLGGGAIRNADDPAGPIPKPETLERLATAAQLARASGLPLLLCGGSVDGDEPEAVAMQRELRSAFGLEARWLETRSRTTQENAEQTARLLAPLGLRRPLLVTSATHMWRAVAEFRAAGLEPVPAPAAGTGRVDIDVRGFLPAAAALGRSSAALYELAGEAVARLSGRR
jgi:uncharacterized SAM-binding protein YcdF (DUF218 family)